MSGVPSTFDRADLTVTLTLTVDIVASGPPLAGSPVLSLLVSVPSRIGDLLERVMDEFAFAVTSLVRVGDVPVRYGRHAGNLNDGRYVRVRFLHCLSAYLLYLQPSFVARLQHIGHGSVTEIVPRRACADVFWRDELPVEPSGRSAILFDR